MNECRRSQRSCPKKHPCRRGWTLVETAICMTIGALVFAAAVELLGFAMHSDSSDARATESFHSLDRLAEQFTADVRSASNVESKTPGKAASSWTMKLPDNHRIDYAMQGHSLLRTAYHADKVVERDAFILGDEMTARIELQPSGQPTERDAGSRTHHRRPAAHARRPPNHGPDRLEQSLRVVDEETKGKRMTRIHRHRPTPAAIVAIAAHLC